MHTSQLRGAAEACEIGDWVLAHDVPAWGFNLRHTFEAHRQGKSIRPLWIFQRGIFKGDDKREIAWQRIS